MAGFLSKKSSDTLIFASLVIFFGGAFVAWNFFVKPATAQLAGAQAELLMIGKKKVAAENLASLERQYTQYEKALSSSKLTSWLIDEIGRMAAECNVTLVSAAPGGDSTFADFHKITLRVEANGGYHEFGDFVSRIENSDRFIKVSDCNIEKLSGAADGKVTLRISMTISIFAESV